MAREPVAIDFIGLGERGHVGLMASSTHGSPVDDERVSRVATRLVKPVPTVPEYHRPANTQVMSRMPAVSEGFRNWTDKRTDNAGSNSPFARPGAAGLCQPSWVNKHAMAMRQLQEQSSGLTAEVSEGHSVGHSPSRVAWDLHTSAPASPSHYTTSSSNRFEAFAKQLAQQARKAASMYADPQQASRNNAPMRTSPIGDEAHVNLSGAEPSVSYPHPSSSTQSAGFGSPVPLPLYSRMKPGNAGVENGSIPQQQHQQAAHEVNMAAAHALARPPASGMQPQTAQLTIFYGGMVNVYDEVPLDKAQAIMLLAGKGSTWSSNDTSIPGIGCGFASGRLVATDLPSAVSQPPSRTGSPVPQVITTTSVAPPPPSGPVPTISNRPTPTTTGVELPQARKASLARFLERRKDRVRKGPYTNRNNDLATHEARMRLNGENSPSPSSSSRLPRRSHSPPEAGNQNNLSFSAISAGNRQAGVSTSGTASEPNSPKLLSPPRHRSISQERPNEVVSRGSPDINPAASSPSRGKAAAVAKETEHSS